LECENKAKSICTKVFEKKIMHLVKLLLLDSLSTAT
jgi:hypothetical protein